MSKLQSLLNTIIPDDVETEDESSLPDLGDADYVLNLGPQSEHAPAVRANLKKQLDDECADLRADKKELQEQLAEKRALSKESDQPVSVLMAAGKTEDQIIHIRAAGSVAAEMAEDLLDRIQRIDDQIEVIVKKHRNRANRVLDTLSNAEIATRAWLIDFVQGGTRETKLNPERAERSYKQLLHAEKVLSDLLGDPVLAARSLKAVTTFVCPTDQYSTLFSLMGKRSRDTFSASDSPSAVKKRLDDLINQETEQ